MLNITQILFNIDSSNPIQITQYPIKTKAVAGITDTIDDLLTLGVISPSSSPWNTPIQPVKKADGNCYRTAHDLKAVNSWVTEPHQAVPNPTAAVNQLMPTHQLFTVIDLANVFFCLPLAPDLFLHSPLKDNNTLTPECLKDSHLASLTPLPNDTLLI